MNILQNYIPETTGAVCINSASMQQMLSVLPMELFYGVVEQCIKNKVQFKHDT